MIYAALLIAVVLVWQPITIGVAGECTMRPPLDPSKDTLQANYLIPNKTLAPATWNITEVCDLYKQGDMVCCSYNQWKGLQMKLFVMQYKMVNCLACNVAFYRLWCDFTCSMNQSNFVQINAMVPGSLDNRIQSVNVVVTNDFSLRLWTSCKNAGMLGVSSFNAMFINGVQGFFNFLTSNSPQTDPANFNLINAMPIDYSPNSLGLNVSTVENDYACSHMVKSNVFPMPQAVVGGMKLKWFVMLIFSTLVASVFVLGLRNMYLQRQEELAQRSEKTVPSASGLSNKSRSQSIEKEGLLTKNVKDLQRSSYAGANKSDDGVH